MERLEAAMEKARAARRAARAAGVQPVNAAAPAPLVLPPSASVPPAVPAPEVAVPPVPPASSADRSVEALDAQVVQNLLEDEIAFMQHCNSFEYTQILVTMVESALERNHAQAQSNLDQQESLEELHQQVRDLEETLQARVAAHKLITEHEMGEFFKAIGLSKGPHWDAIGFAHGDRTQRL